jgi:acylpyruvate hydrolase
MKLATIATDGVTRACVVVGNELAPIDGNYPDVAAVFRGGALGMDAANLAVETAPRIDWGAATIVRPVVGMVAIVAVGLNYRTHIAELGYDVPTAPTLFSKLPRALTDPNVDIPMPTTSDELDYEGEFAVIIGKAGRSIPEHEAWDHVGGLTLMNDVSVRDYQKRSSQWFAGKSWEASTPMGPTVVTRDELGEARLTVSVNGELRQTADLSDLIFDVPRLVADISTMFTLHPGDIIATGTPGGVGSSWSPTKFLVPGDTVVVECQSIGVLTNRVGRVPAAPQ